MKKSGESQMMGEDCFCDLFVAVLDLPAVFLAGDHCPKIVDVIHISYNTTSEKMRFCSRDRGLQDADVNNVGCNVYNFIDHSLGSSAAWSLRVLLHREHRVHI